MTARRTPAQDHALRLYRTERRLGLHPLDAIDRVRAHIALVGFAVARQHDWQVSPVTQEEMRAADAIKAQIVAREHAQIGLVAAS